MFKVFFLLLLAPSQSWKLVFCVWQQQSKACYLYSLGCLPWLALQVALDAFSVMCSRAAQHGCLAARDQQNLDKYPSFFSWLSLLWTTAPCKIKSFDTTDWLKKDSTLFNCGCESSRKCNLKSFFIKLKKENLEQSASVLKTKNLHQFSSPSADQNLLWSDGNDKPQTWSVLQEVHLSHLFS